MLFVGPQGNARKFYRIHLPTTRLPRFLNILEPFRGVSLGFADET